MKLASVTQFPNTSLADISGKLRDLADNIDAGTWGDADACIVVLSSEVVHTFGFGVKADGVTGHYLLCCAARKIEDAAL